MTTRRRFLTILAGVSALPFVGTHAVAATKSWQGVALGAKAQIVLDHPNAQILLAEAVSEIRRLEGIFSLYDTDSQLSQLNRLGFLAQPAFEFVELLSLCGQLHRQTSGAFDPTVQPLWALYARAFSAGRSPEIADIEETKNLIGWPHVSFDTGAVHYTKPGFAMTLNGVAQGFIADKITALLRRNGVVDVLVNAGEISALGMAPDGAPWRVRLANGDESTVPLINASIATSSPRGTVFDVDGEVGHIIDPRTGYPGGQWEVVSVIAPSAAMADGLSTAFCLMARDGIDAVAGAHDVILGAPIWSS